MTPCLEGTGKGNVINAPSHMGALRSPTAYQIDTEVCPKADASILGGEI
jgi:hypothetical protein